MKQVPNFYTIDPSNSDMMKKLEYQSCFAGHPDVYIEGYLDGPDDSDFILREYYEKNIAQDFPEEFTDDPNGSYLTTALAYKHDKYPEWISEDWENIEAVKDMWWGGNCEESVRLRMKGSYRGYTSCGYNHVCFVVDPSTITVEEILAGEYEMVSRGVGMEGFFGEDI